MYSKGNPSCKTYDGTFAQYRQTINETKERGIAALEEYAFSHDIYYETYQEDILYILKSNTNELLAELEEMINFLQLFHDTDEIPDCMNSQINEAKQIFNDASSAIEKKAKIFLKN
ncbi:hypothetical protein PVAND_015568 [Polypedilum vanderplanki]|uniref:Uncharacterized protein n=1 Tax=Polypedilum vanderplanki TaxID=319348 RepID=A0A9J6BDD7_POLVA|nr:hypothetical protein PVAND_015568 [Polypedilum vanderplanki]